MKLIVIYGPPGVGKLTIAEILAKKTGYRLFHNHLTIDLLRSLFPTGSHPYNKLVHQYRFDLLETAAKYKVPGVIFTYVYAAKVDDAEMKKLIRVMKKHRAQVLFVQVLCDQAVLEKRVLAESRKKYGKIHHVAGLRRVMKKYNTVLKIPFGNNFTVDSTKTSPARNAAKIVEHFRL